MVIDGMLRCRRRRRRGGDDHRARRARDRGGLGGCLDRCRRRGGTCSTGVFAQRPCQTKRGKREQPEQDELRLFHGKHNIATEAWSPLGQGKILEDEKLKAIAAKHGKSVAQVILRWHIETGNIVIPKSVTPARIKENFEVFDFSLNGTDHDAITKLDKTDGRIGPKPATFSAG